MTNLSTNIFNMFPVSLKIRHISHNGWNRSNLCNTDNLSSSASGSSSLKVTSWSLINAAYAHKVSLSCCFFHRQHAACLNAIFSHFHLFMLADLAFLYTGGLNRSIITDLTNGKPSQRGGGTLMLTKWLYLLARRLCLPLLSCFQRMLVSAPNTTVQSVSFMS